jgi:hypothetical protein
MAGLSTWQEVSPRSLYFQNSISGSLNLASGVVWTLNLASGVIQVPTGPNPL